jgi:hypothetical protein
MDFSAENTIGNPSLLNDADAASFPAPWAARAFAMTRTLSIAGHFTWAEWAQGFWQELHAAFQCLVWTTESISLALGRALPVGYAPAHVSSHEEPK